MATKKHAEGEPEKIATFLWLVGEQGLEIFNTLFPTYDCFGSPPVAAETNASESSADIAPTVVQQLKLTTVLSAFDEHCLPKRNLAMEVFKLNVIAQKENQPFMEFETTLRSQIKCCEYKCTNCQTSYAERILRDKIIVGVNDKNLQLRLLDGADKPLDKVIQICKAFEVATINKSILDSKQLSVEVNAVSKRQVKAPMNNCFNCGKPFIKNHRESALLKMLFAITVVGRATSRSFARPTGKRTIW